MLRNQGTETYYIWFHPLSWKLFSHMQITCYYVTSLSCILSIQSLHNTFTNSKHEQTTHLQQLCLDYLFFGDTRHHTKFFCSLLAWLQVQCLSILFSVLVGYCNKLFNCSLLCKCLFESSNEQSTWMFLWIVTLLAYTSQMISILTAVTFIRVKNKVTGQYVLFFDTYQIFHTSSTPTVPHFTAL